MSFSKIIRAFLKIGNKTTPITKTCKTVAKGTRPNSVWSASNVTHNQKNTGIEIIGFHGSNNEGKTIIINGKPYRVAKPVPRQNRTASATPESAVKNTKPQNMVQEPTMPDIPPSEPRPIPTQATPKPVAEKPVVINGKQYTGEEAKKLKARAKIERDMYYDLDTHSREIARKKNLLSDCERRINQKENEIREYWQTNNPKNKYHQTLNELEQEHTNVHKNMINSQSELQRLEIKRNSLSTKNYISQHALKELENAAASGRPANLSRVLGGNKADPEIAAIYNRYNIALNSNKPAVLQEMKLYAQKQTHNLEKVENQIKQHNFDIEKAKNRLAEIKNSQTEINNNIKREMESPEFREKYNQLNNELTRIQSERNRITDEINNLESEKNKLRTNFEKMQREDIGLSQNWFLSPDL